MDYVNLPSNKFIFIINFEGFSWSDMDPRVGVNVAFTLGNQYPERLAYAIAVDSPMIFQPALEQ